jgi:hypothetical protein
MLSEHDSGKMRDAIPSIKNVYTDLLGSSLHGGNLFVCDDLAEVIIGDVSQVTLPNGKAGLWRCRVDV